MALSGWFNPKLSVHEGEAMGLWTAINWVLSLGFNNVILNVTHIMVDAIHSRNVDISDFSSIVSSIRRILASNYNFDVKFI